MTRGPVTHATGRLSIGLWPVDQVAQSMSRPLGTGEIAIRYMDRPNTMMVISSFCG